MVAPQTKSLPDSGRVLEVSFFKWLSLPEFKSVNEKHTRKKQGAAESKDAGKDYVSKIHFFFILIPPHGL